MDQFELKRAQRVARIREVALQLFAETGFEKTTIRLIAREANMAIGLLYNYYSSKEELLKDIFRTWQQQLDLTLQPDGDHLKSNDVESYIRQTIRLVKANRPFWKLIYGIRMQSPIIRQLEAEMKTSQDLVQKQIETYLVNAGIPFPGLEAKLLFATLDGLILHYLQQDNFPLDDTGNLLIMKYHSQEARRGAI
jgi:AcrR family transcriptional regulator